MTIARVYRMTAAEGQEDTLAATLVSFADDVRALEGCVGVVVMRDTADPAAFLFVERWTSVEAHKAGASGLSKEAIAGLMAPLAAPPQGSYLEELRSV